MRTSFAMKLGLLLFVPFTSCQTHHPLSKHNYFDGSILYNDPLNIRFEYFGDVQFEELEKIDKKKIKNTIKDLKEVSPGDLLAYGSTNLNPDYEVMLFIKDVRKAPYRAESIKLVLEDTINNRVLYKKTAGKKIAYLLLNAFSDNESTVSIRKDGAHLMRDLIFDADFEEELSYSKIFASNRENPNYLKTRHKLKEAPVPSTDQNEWMQFQFLATVNSFMQKNPEHGKLIREFEINRIEYLEDALDTQLIKPEVVKNADVLENVAVLSEDTRVLMLNENHWYPKHRLLGYKLLEPLKAKGYTHLALEALFKNQDSIINDKGFPTFSSGYYTRETYFGHFIRKARELGFEIMEYESYDKDVNRELGQAQNLADLLNTVSDAKVFVYAGLDHIIEEATVRGKSMAVHLKELTNINPLTVNQVDVVSEIGDELVMIPFDDVRNIKKLERRPVDFFIINNLEPALEEIFSGSELKKMKIKDEILSEYASENLLVNVYQLNEYNSFKSKAVPISSSLEKVSTENTIELVLPLGEYFIRILSLEDDTVLAREMQLSEQ